LKYLLDTSFLIGYIRKEKNALNIFNYLIKEEGPFFICAISNTQILANIKKFENFNKIKDFLDSFETININKEITIKAGKLGYDLAKKGITIPDIDDLIINIICHENNLILVTSNIKHFPNLKNKILEYKY
jgi:predicted nucleic acid-binding protein